MCEASQRGALAGGLGLVVGIQLDDVAEGVELVAVVIAAVSGHAQLAVVPARVLVVCAAGFPAVAAIGSTHNASSHRQAPAIALERGHALVVAGGVVGGVAEKVTGPVFLARQEAAPRGFSGAAVVQRAACLGAVGRMPGHHQGVAACRSIELDVLAQAGQAEVGGGTLYRGPLGAGFFDFDHGHAMNGGFLVHFNGRARQRGGAAIEMQKERTARLVGRRFVIHGDQAAINGRGGGLAAGIEAEPFHAVMVVTGAVFKVSVGAVILVGRGGGSERVAQRIQHAGGVAGGHRHGVGHGFGHGGKAQEGFRRRCRCRCRHDGQRIAPAATGQGQAAQQGGAHAAHAAAQQAAAAQAGLQHAVKTRVVRGVGIFVVEIDRLRHQGVLRLVRFSQPEEIRGAA